MFGLLANFFSRAGLEIPFLTFTVVPRLHSFYTCILYKESGVSLSLSLTSVCDPPITYDKVGLDEDLLIEMKTEESQPVKFVR